ncbi:uncharacterized protein [Chelonus insularis]|uniref:uncharacterized protein isoform X2 n=1 Tax=Chelonus insularis TaxID=460826 RepID=UPI00158AC92C|nr:uncharacterized protein LOC118066071 isoform X2 [Chelonus insularis]XP_034937719.1 uncharacterized protein LOC118066071 isoform X2 [Chelonus insularis]XP_034937720.1 uncharacterized protein LOC118066071 isoform X2 [Chelonus insularis]
MDDTVNTYDHRQSECSGRSLATLLIAWVSAALVASVLLRWKYMWIALAVLTLLFLIACGYAASTHRRNTERSTSREETRIIDGRNRNIPTVSGGVDNNTDIIAPPAYQTYWINDLPPSYTVVIGTQPPTGAYPMHVEELFTPRPSNPPPYSVATQHDHTQSSSDTHQLPGQSISSIVNENDNKENDITRDQNVLSHGSAQNQYFNNLISTSCLRSDKRTSGRNVTNSSSTNQTSSCSDVMQI